MVSGCKESLLTHLDCAFAGAAHARIFPALKEHSIGGNRANDNLARLRPRCDTASSMHYSAKEHLHVVRRGSGDRALTDSATAIQCPAWRTVCGPSDAVFGIVFCGQ